MKNFIIYHLIKILKNISYDIIISKFIKKDHFETSKSLI